MEIREWIRSLGDRARLLVIIPLAAGTLAALVTLVGPATYIASATLILPEDPGTGPLTAVTAQRVADFAAAVRSEGVLDAVAKETGLSRGDIDAVTVTRNGTSGVITVSFSSTDADRVGPVAETAARSALTAIAQVRVDAATAEVEAAQALYDTAEKAYLDETVELGEIYSLLALDRLTKQYIDTGDAANRASAQGNAAEANRQRDKHDRKGNQITVMQRLQLLFNARQAAASGLFVSQASLTRAQGALNAADTLTIAVTRPVRQSKLREAARRFLFVAAVGFILALLLVVLLQVIQGRSGNADDDLDGGSIRSGAKPLSATAARIGRKS